MVTEVRPLYYTGTPTEEQRRALRAGKELLDVDWLVQPTAYNPEVHDGPVLAFEEPRFYIQLYAKLTPPYTPARMAVALKQMYGLAPPDHLTTGEDWIRRFLPGTTFIEEVQLEHDNDQGRNRVRRG